MPDGRPLQELCPGRLSAGLDSAEQGLRTCQVQEGADLGIEQGASKQAVLLQGATPTDWSHRIDHVEGACVCLHQVYGSGFRVNPPAPGEPNKDLARSCAAHCHCWLKVWRLQPRTHGPGFIIVC